MGIKVIKQLRKTKGYTQEEIAVKLNIDRSTYSTWENQKVDLTLSQLRKIADAYEIKVFMLVKLLDGAHTEMP